MLNQSINQSINQNNHSERNSPAPRRNPKTEKIVNEALKRDFLAKGGSDEKDNFSDCFDSDDFLLIFLSDNT